MESITSTFPQRAFEPFVFQVIAVVPPAVRAEAHEFTTSGPAASTVTVWLEQAAPPLQSLTVNAKVMVLATVGRTSKSEELPLATSLSEGNDLVGELVGG